jgi:hypothetical protein
VRRRWILALAVAAWALAIVLLREASPPPAAPAPARCANAGALDATLFLVGDAGAPAPGEPVLEALAAAGAEQVAALGPERVAVAFLGDNVYPDGVPAEGDPGRAEAEHRLRAQIEVARRARLRAFFVPGNHDWGDGVADGWERVRRQTRLVAESGVEKAVAVPANGCPGPVRARLGARLDLLFLDTHWWLHPGPKPQGRDPGCAPADEAAVLGALASSLANRGGRHSIVMGHHPLVTGGPHSGRFAWREHLFPLRALHRALWIPLPIVGSGYPLARQLGVSVQDLSSDRYAALRAMLGETLAVSPPLVFAAGHDHGLQVIRDGRVARFQLVSGAGSSRQLTWVYPVAGTLFARAASGYARLDAFAGGAVELAVLETPWGAPPALVYSACLTE